MAVAASTLLLVSNVAEEAVDPIWIPLFILGAGIITFVCAGFKYLEEIKDDKTNK